RRVVGGEAVPGLALAARAALPAHGAPVEDDAVPDGDLGDALTDGGDDAGGLVPEEEGEVVADPADLVVEVGLAHAARDDVDERLPRARVGDEDRLHRGGGVLLLDDDGLDLVHGVSSLRAT